MLRGGRGGGVNAWFSGERREIEEGCVAFRKNYGAEENHIMYYTISE